MEESFAELVARARKALGRLDLANGFSAGTVAAAVQTDRGNIYTGICIDVACGMGFCAEHAAVAEMLKNRETRVTRIVAVTEEGYLAPCGRCREFMYQVDPRNADAQVLVSGGRAATLRELLPERRGP